MLPLGSSVGKQAHFWDLTKTGLGEGSATPATIVKLYVGVARSAWYSGRNDSPTIRSNTRSGGFPGCPTPTASGPAPHRAAAL
jgi:hypothetical protein